MRITLTGLLLATAIFGFSATMSIGCNTSTPTADDHDHDHDDHDHDHGDHDHDEHADHGEIGPNGGHIVELEGGPYHLEWVHPEGKPGEVTEKIITFYVLDAEAKKEFPIAAEAIMVQLATGGETTEVAAPADRPEGADKTAKFVLTDELGATILTSEEVDATVTFDVDGKQLKGKIEDHHHHH